MKLELVRQPISENVIEALEELLADARAGLYTGFVIGLLRPRQRYTVHCIGEACERPTWALGICSVMAHELQKVVDAESQEETRF